MMNIDEIKSKNRTRLYNRWPYYCISLIIEIGMVSILA